MFAFFQAIMQNTLSQPAYISSSPFLLTASEICPQPQQSAHPPLDIVQQCARFLCSAELSLLLQEMTGLPLTRVCDTEVRAGVSSLCVCFVGFSARERERYVCGFFHYVS